MIRIAPSIHPSRLWSFAVFELLNLAGTDRFDQLEDSAFEGRVSRSDWLKNFSRIEYTTFKRLKYFGKTVWEPHAESRGFEPDMDLWDANLPETFDEWYAQEFPGPPDPSVPATRKLLDHYDKVIVPHLKRMGIPIPK